jgi:hypothetical protein
MEMVSPSAVLGRSMALLERLQEVRQVMRLSAQFQRLEASELPGMAAVAGRLRMLRHVLQQRCGNCLDVAASVWPEALADFRTSVADSVGKEALATVRSILSDHFRRVYNGAPTAAATTPSPDAPLTSTDTTADQLASAAAVSGPPTHETAGVAPDTIAISLRLLSRLRHVFWLEVSESSSDQSDVLADIFVEVKALRSHVEDLLATHFFALVRHLDDVLEATRVNYDAHRSQPPLERNATPIAGAIAWSRLLLRGIRAPTELLQSAGGEAAMRTREVKAVIKKFNRIALTLVTFEQEWLVHWQRTLDSVLAATRATLLVDAQTPSKRPAPPTSHRKPLGVRHTKFADANPRSPPPAAPPTAAAHERRGSSAIPPPEAPALVTPMFLVNYDSTLDLALREMYLLRQLSIELPSAAVALFSSRIRLKAIHSELTFAIAELRRIAAIVPVPLRPLFAQRFEAARDMFAAGVTSLTWASTQAIGYASDLSASVTMLSKLVADVSSIYNTRYVANIEAIRTVTWTAVVARRNGETPLTYSSYAASSTQPWSTSSGSHRARSAHTQDAFFASQGIQPIYSDLDALLVEQVAHARATAERVNRLSCAAAEGLQDACLAVVHAAGDARKSHPTDNGAVVEGVMAEHELALQAAIVDGIRASIRELRVAMAPITASIVIDTPRPNAGRRDAVGATYDATPLLAVKVEMRAGTICCLPSGDDLQHAINTIARSVLESTNFVYTWRQTGDGSSPSEGGGAGAIVYVNITAVQQALVHAADRDAAKFMAARRQQHVQSMSAGARGLRRVDDLDEATGISPSGRRGIAIGSTESTTDDGTSTEHTSMQYQPVHAGRGTSPPMDGATQGSTNPFDNPRYSVIPHGYHVQAVKAMQVRSLYLRIGKDAVVVKAFLQLLGCFAPLQRSLTAFLEYFSSADKPFAGDRTHAALAFQQKKPPPTIEEYAAKLDLFNAVLVDLDAAPRLQLIANIVLDLRPLRESIRTEALAWIAAFGNALSSSVTQRLKVVSHRMDAYRVRLTRPLLELSDVNAVSASVAEFRTEQSSFDDELRPALEAHDLLIRSKVRVPKEDVEVAEAVTAARAALPALADRAHDELGAQSLKFRVLLLHGLQELDASVATFCREYRQHGPNVAGIGPKEASEKLAQFAKMHADRQRRWLKFKQSQELFRVQQRTYPEFVAIGKEMGLLSRLYDLYAGVLAAVQNTHDAAWITADLSQAEQAFAVFRDRCESLPRSLREFPAYIELRQLLADTLVALPYLARLRDRGVKRRHWDALARVVGVPLDPETPDLRLRHLLDLNLANYTQELEDLLSSAAKEADIESKLLMIGEMNNRVVVLGPFKSRGEVVLKADATAELLQDLEDAQALLSMLATNRHNEFFKRDIDTWITRLGGTQQRLEQWLEVQQLWMYLEAVFVASGDISREMPQEVKRFTGVDRQWTKLMAMAAETPKLMRLCAPGEPLAGALPHLRSSLELCQQSLLGYMSSKRIAFPRFFFLSDPQLLDILGKSTDPTSITPHLTSLTSNVVDVTFNASAQLLDWTSGEGETVRLIAPMNAEADILLWLASFLKSMRQTLRVLAVQMHDDIAKRFDDFSLREMQSYISHFPGQIALLGLQLLWTQDVEHMLIHVHTNPRDVIAQKLTRAKKLLDTMVEISTNPSINRCVRVRLESMITVQIHQLDVMVNLARNIKRVRGLTDFDWTKQMRCVWRTDRDEVGISITDVDFAYGYEYIGSVERLVVTDLTDRIYISCAQAIGMGFGGAPTGPAGTGKTETTRDLGRACGRFFIVINCSELMSVAGMAKLIRGIAQSGCWCGFDEINRVDVGILSVVAAQIAAVFNAQRAKKNHFTFTDGSVVQLDRECAIFVTMNPSYAGRTELPENMKSLFRSVAVVVPDRAAIVRVRLAASGYQDSVGLTKKVNALYSTATEQLSQQPFYDFGLRNILSVLRTCGPALRAAKAASAASGAPLDETQVIAGVISSMNASKLLDDDAVLFDRLMSNLFGNSTAGTAPTSPAAKANISSSSAASSIRSTIYEVLEAKQLAAPSEWVDRIVMFADQWDVRHGLCVMGPPASGKSMLLSTISAVVSKLRSPSKLYRVNPKALTSSQLFGSFDPKTGDWSDGVLVSLWRRAGRRKTDHNAIVLDGPVDSVWIENLNSVLDDTRVLTLASGERLPLPPNLRIVFEVDHLRNASPATVSRLGLVCLGHTTLGSQPLLHGVLRKLSRVGLTRQVVDAITVTLHASIDVVASCIARIKSQSDADGTVFAALLASNCAKLLDAYVTEVLAVRAARHDRWQQQNQNQQHRTNYSPTVTDADGAASVSSRDSKNEQQLASPDANLVEHDGRLIASFVVLSSAGAMLVHANELAALSATLEELATETRQNPAPTAAKPSRNATKHAKAAEPASPVSAAPLPLLLPDRGYNEASFTVFDYVLEPSDLNWLSWTEFASRDRRNTQSPSNHGASVLSSKQGAADRTKGGRLAADGKKVRPTLLDPLPFILSPHYAQIQFFMALHTRARNPFLLVGGGGTGKSSAAAQFMRQGVDSSVRRRQLTLSYATTTTTLQNLVCNVLDRHGAASFGPRLGESFALLYVDDAHLPAVGVWGDQPTSELLRFMIEDGSVFQLLGHNTIESATIVNTMFAAAITESDAGVHTIPLRLRRHFAAIRVSEPDTATIENIYTSIVSRHFSAANGFSAQIAESSKSIGPAMCQLWRFAKQQFVRTPKAFHYVFSMTDLTRMANGLLLARPLAVNTIESLYQLVLNEAQRTMSDKLISDNEITTFATHARKVVHETLQPARISDWRPTGNDGGMDCHCF